MKENIKWACIQPLTGGMYLGAEQAIGHPAEWILSFPGLNDKDGNEANLTEYLKKVNRQVPYYTFTGSMFQESYSNMVIYPSLPDYEDLDIVVSVPVCSGLSMVTSASKETKDSKNCNMLFITEYTLKIIKPKMFIFENAPTMMAKRGDEIRMLLESIAAENGYKLLYYKTDTKFHNNCQCRPRTFVVFQRADVGLNKFELNHSEITLEDYMKHIPEGATQQTPLKMSVLNEMIMEFAKVLFGDDWRTESRKRLLDNIFLDHGTDAFLEFLEGADISEKDKESIEKFIDHANFKLSIGKNFMSNCLVLPDEHYLSVQFKNMQAMIHNTEDRLLTVRECLHLMGMPHDFELLGDVAKNYMKIGQNVPVGTAKFIVEQAVLGLEGKLEKNDEDVLFIDNTKW